MTDVKVCIGTSCHLKGSYNVLMSFQQLVEQHGLHDSVMLSSAFCMGNCQNGVCVTIDDENFSLKPEDTKSFFENDVLPRLK